MYVFLSLVYLEVRLQQDHDFETMVYVEPLRGGLGTV